MGVNQYRGIFSSDWSECLSPNGPFDPIAAAYPQLDEDLRRIFREYTGNRISLRQATSQIRNLMPEPLSAEQMDSYLKQHFRTYSGVPELMQWCLEKGILFMINTTGTQGYFQRVFELGLLPEIPVVAANPMIRFGNAHYARYAHEVLEIEDKAKNTRAVMESLGLQPANVVVMGDSGGDGPHFRWASQAGAFTIGSMTKSSLDGYCASHGIHINHFFGLKYAPAAIRDHHSEMAVDFKELAKVIARVLLK